MAKGGTKKAQEERVDEQLAEVQRLLEIEDREWQRAGIHTAGVGGNFFMLDSQVVSLITFLFKEEIVDPKELDLHFKNITLERLREFRKSITSSIIEEQIKVGPKLLGPDGREIMH